MREGEQRGSCDKDGNNEGEIKRTVNRRAKKLKREHKDSEGRKEKH